jgi:hypothetical protein
VTDSAEEKYRTAFTLCVLGGRSQKAAAGLLGRDPGTVAAHLFRARRRLQRQLVRRGVTLSAALTVAALTQHVSAKAPSPMIRATLRAMQGPASTLSAEVVALLQGATSPLRITRAAAGPRPTVAAGQAYHA